MDKRIPILAITIAVIFSVVFSSAAIIIANNNAVHYPEQPAYEKYTLYVGTDYISEEDYENLVAYQNSVLENIVMKYTTGYTSYLATGCSFTESGPIRAPGTIVIVVGMVEPGSAWIKTMVEEIFDDTHIQALLVEKTSGDYKLLIPEP